MRYREALASGGKSEALYETEVKAEILADSASDLIGYLS